MNKLLNMRTADKKSLIGAIRIDRQTKWGNPYKINKLNNREQVIEKYKIYLWKKIQNNEITLSELAALHNKNLKCWCAPLLCHGEVLQKAAKWAYESLSRKNHA